MDREALVHFVAGAVGGTAGAAITCPLEVVKVRLQSSEGATITDGLPRVPPRASGPSRHADRSAASVMRASSCQQRLPSLATGGVGRRLHISAAFKSHCTTSARPYSVRFALTRHFLQAHIIKTEGLGALWKGLGPNLIGVAPSKAVYFYTYANSKRALNRWLVPDTAIVHMLSAGFAGFVAATVVNPIWLVKTRLQLDHGKVPLFQCVRQVYANEGLKGFYKGVTASYVGISEAIIQFVLYEYLRTFVVANGSADGRRQKMDFAGFMFCGGAAKLVATTVTYPHEVVRTRLREEGSQYRGFARTLVQVGREEGARGLYRGMVVQLMRTAPNTAIVMGSYELVVYLLSTLHH